MSVFKKHKLKCWRDPFKATLSGSKPWEFRKNDRDFRPGDVLVLEEYDPDADRYTGRSIMRSVSYMLKGPLFGIPAGYCVMTLVQEVPDDV
jgi:hypothetical protein